MKKAESRKANPVMVMRLGATHRGILSTYAIQTGTVTIACAKSDKK
jgi:hypothetical protein